MTLIPGQFIGQRYQIIQKMGEGSFGKAYLAKDNNAIGREVLVKRFCYHVQNRTFFPKAKELFFREAEVLLELSNNPPRCDHIPQFYAFFEENQEFYLVEEFIKGKTLREELTKRVSLTEDEIINLLVDLLEVLNFIHGRKIIHRDIKPENIILRDIDNKPVLIDFGAVKEVLAQSTNSTQGKDTIILTPGYAPLEQFQGKPQFNSDIYALGMTALEALTALEPEDLKYQSISSVILSSKAKINKKLEKIIERMLDKDCRSRYLSASEVLADLKKVNHTKTSPTVVVPPKKFLAGKPIQPITPQLSKYLLFIPLGIVMVAGVSFFAVRNLILPQPSVSNQPSKPVNSVSPKVKETPADPVSPQVKETPDNSISPKVKETPANSVPNKEISISAPVQPSPDSNSSTPEDSSPIRFKRANTPENSTDTGIKLEPQPNSTAQSSDSSEAPIRFKRSR